MKIGIVGLGVVGKACRDGFEKGGHEVNGHDIVLNTKIEDLISSEIIYLTVPTPQMPTGECNTSIVASVVKELSEIKYGGIIAVKSTVPPGTVSNLSKTYKDLNICFVPEFLKERSAGDDFINHGTLIVGANDKNEGNLIYKSHSHLTDKWILVSPAEAEVTKYFHNVFNAARISFANEMFDICQAVDASYDNVLKSALARNSYSSEYLMVNEALRGYAGVCLPKDVSALAKFCEQNNIPGELIKAIGESNKNRKKTVIGDMRLE